jgi:hypothetical protein
MFSILFYYIQIMINILIIIFKNYFQRKISDIPNG